MKNNIPILKIIVIFYLFVLIGCGNNAPKVIEKDKKNNENFVVSNNVTESSFIKDTIIQSCLYIETPLTDFLYVGVDNIIKINNDESFKKSMKPVIDNGSIVNVSNDTYAVSVKKVGSTFIKIIDAENNTVLFEKKYKIKRLPNATIDVGQNLDFSIDKKVIVNKNNVSAEIYNLDIDLHCEVLSFTLSTFNKKRGFIQNNSNSDNFTEEQKTQLKELDSGDKVYFENIKVLHPDGTKRIISPVILSVL